MRPDRRELIAAHLWAAGATGVWEQPDLLVAWFEQRPPWLGTGAASPDTGIGGMPDGGPQDALDELGAATWSIETDRDWQAEWKATIRPVRAGRFVVVPTWLADEHTPAPDESTLVLDPGRAFGSGHHATTTLCLEFLDDLALQGRSVADIGCGTGILAIAAAQRGASVVGVDLDPDAVAVTRENAARNHVEVTVAPGSVDVLTEPADVVVANLVTDVVVALAAGLVEACRDTLVVSGIATERQERALGALTGCGAEVVEVRERDGWIAARLRTTATDPDATDRDATDRDATDPDATDPDATDPDATDRARSARA